MTLWNPLNVFSSSQRRAASVDLSASFDPSTTGDPLGPGYHRPAIGFGGTSVGEPARHGEPRRRPIGFAPADDEMVEPRYRTEISFKRHHEAPRASVTPDQPEESPQDPWQTPEQGHADVFGGDTGPVGAVDAVDETPAAAEERVPFYKREISFRRKHASTSEAPETIVADEDAPDELAAQLVDHSDEVELDAGQASDAALAGTLAEIEAASDGAEESPDGAEAPGADERVPFYKREISFRRKHDTPEEAVAAAVVATHDDPVDLDEAPDVTEADAVLSSWDAPAEDVSVDEVETVAVSFAEESAEAELDVEPVAAEHVATGNVAAADPIDDVVDESELADAVEPAGEAPVADELPVAVAAAVGMAGLDAASEVDDLFIEDTPPPKGRFSSRKGKSTEKSPKRKQARGGKGRRVVGLKIGASQIAAAVVAETDAGHELVELARRPLAAGIVVDGEIRDLDALSNALKAFFEDEKLPKKDVRIGLASNRIGVRTFDIVGVDDAARFDNAVRFKAHEVLPVAAHESVLDYRVLEERPNEAGEPSRRVLLVVAPRDQVEPYAEVANRVGIKLAGIDLEALGLLRAFVDPKPFAVRAVDDTATVVVSIGHESSTLLVAGGGACEFTRVFDWGGSALEEAIATSLEVHPAEAATILRHLSLSGPGRQFDALDEVARAKALDAVRLRLTPFARELVSSLQFYQTQNESLGIGGIVITGGTSHLEGLGDALNQMIGVNVTVGDPLARVIRAGEYAPAIEAVIGSMAVPIGLAIDDIAMRGVNLLPKDAVATKSRRSTMIAIGAPIAAAVPLVALGVMYLGAHGKASDNKAELTAVQAEIAALPKPQGPEIDAAIVGDEAVRATAVASVLGGRLAWDSVFRDMARVLPTNVWLKSLSASLPQVANLADGTTAPVAVTTPGQADPAPTAVVIEGYTYTQPDVARLLARLATLPSLERVTLTSSARELVGKEDVVRFVIVADLNQTGGVS